MKLEQARKILLERWGEIRNLHSVEELLSWDQEVCLPPKGVEARARVCATMAGIKHRHLEHPELREALDVCGEQAEEGSELAAQVRVARLEVERAVAVPESLVRALAEARSTGLSAWRKGREQEDFSLFEPHLERLVELRRQEAAAIDPGREAYEVLLQGYEPDAEVGQLVPLFRDLREALVPMVAAVADCGHMVDEGPALGNYPAEAQEAFGRRVAEAVGFDFDAGRLDASTHPFCIGFDPLDVRMTWRYQEDDFRPAFSGILHETGHALYEQGLPRNSEDPLATAVSLGLHESQSRLWENQVGCSRGFWRWALPHYRELFPDSGPADLDALWPALHVVRPSLVRVDADEVTYNLHIVLRFDIERALFSGDLEVTELPQVWNDAYQDLLGIRPDNDALGVLQDIHWSQGLFGYFPTYTLGSAVGAQLFAAAGRELGDLEERFAEGDFGSLLDWLRRNVHGHGARYPAPELVERVTGKDLSADDLLEHLRTNVEEVYGVRLPASEASEVVAVGDSSQR